MAKNVLELNGKRYDAITGAYLGVGVGTVAAVGADKGGKQPSKSQSKGRAIDGFIRPSGGAGATKAAPASPRIHDVAKPAAKKAGASAVQAHVTHPVRTSAPSAKAVHNTVAKPAPKSSVTTAVVASKPAVAAASTPKKAAAEAIPVTVTKNAGVAGHKPEKSKTLMRRAVHKPSVTIKPAIKPQSPAEIAIKDPSAINPKPSALQVDENRLERAKSVAKPSAIRHFQPVHPDFTPETIHTTPRAATTVVPPIVVHQAPPIMPQRAAETSIFEAALARAESHKQPAHRLPKKHSKHRGLVNAVAGVAAFLVIAGFIGYLNLPNIQLHLASAQAGFSATMPGYRPEGYAMKGGVQRIGNTVSMRFMAGENHYTVTEQPSDWNSQTLVDNTVALSSGTYKTIQAGGRNVYVYNGSNAVWVDGGVRYDLTSNAPLNTDDITQLAASL